jgi:hypothetical protein
MKDDAVPMFRARRLKQIHEKYGEKAKELMFCGISIRDLSKKDLLAILAMKCEKLTEIMNGDKYDRSI